MQKTGHTHPRWRRYMDTSLRLGALMTNGRDPQNQTVAVAVLLAAFAAASGACGGSDQQRPADPKQDGGPTAQQGGDQGGDGDGDDGRDAEMPGGDSAPCDMESMFAQKCGTSTCHEGSMAQVGLDLVTPGVGARLSGAPAMCGGLLADSSDPGASMLYLKLGGSPSCGSAMPLGLPPLDDDELQCVRAWISGLLPPPPPEPKDTPDEGDGDPPPAVAIAHECTSVGDSQACYSGPEDTLDVGMCHSGMQTCIAGDDGEANVWGPCEDDYTGLAENCNTDENEDCDDRTPATGCTASWSRSYGMPGSSQNGRSVAIDSQGNVFLLGDYEASVNLGAGLAIAPGGKANVFLSKYDGFGNVLWVKTYGDTSSQFGQQVIVDHEDNPILLVRAYGTAEYWEATDDASDDLDGPGETDIHVVKLDTDGGHIWSHVFGGVSADRAEDLAVDVSNNVYVTGAFKGVADFGARILKSARYADEPADRDMFILKIGASGTVTFAARYGGNGDDYGRGIAVDADGNIHVAGYFGGSFEGEAPATIGFGGPVHASAGDRDIFVAKLDDKLAHIWSMRFGDSGIDELQDIALNSDGELVATGAFSGELAYGDQNLTSAGERDLLLMKFAVNGDVVFAKGFGDSEDQPLTEIGPEHTWSALAVDASDNIYLSTSMSGEARFGDTPISEILSAGKTDVTLVKFDADAGFLWGRRYGKAGTELVLDAAVDSAGMVVVTGRIFGTELDFGPAGAVIGRPPSATAYIAKIEPAD